MINLVTDVREVHFDLTGEHRAPIDQSGTTHPCQLIPDWAVVTFDLLTGQVARVKVGGRKRNDDGTPHRTLRRDWSWAAGFGSYAQTWPPANAPAVALAAVEHAQTATTA